MNTWGGGKGVVGMMAAALLGGACGSTPPAREPSGIAAQATFCLPEPVPYRPTIAAPDPAVLARDCGVTSIDRDSGGDGGAEWRTVYTRHGDEVIEQVWSAGQPAGPRIVYRTDGAGRLVGIWRYEASGELTATDRWTFDADGNLLLEERSGVTTYYYGGGRRAWSSRVAQTWEGGRLIAREHLDSSGQVWVYRWSYDGAGRLREGVLRGVGRAPVWRAVWTYDAAGRPASVVRESSGREVLRQSWSYNAAGGLRARQIVATAGTADVRSGLDSYDDDRTAVGLDPWAGATSAAGERCSVLPTSIGHGYPQAEPEYLLTPADFTDWLMWLYPSRSGRYAYSYYGYARWYGHRGAGSPWLDDEHSDGPVRIEIRYDGRGRMILETGHREGGSLLRQRVFDGGGLRSDRVLYLAETSPPLERTLSFARDARGRILRRELRDARGLLEYQGWSYDAIGLAGYEFATQDHYQGLDPVAALEAPGALGVPLLHSRVRRVRDASGLAFTDELDRVNGHPGRRWVRSDAAGRVVERITWFEGGSTTHEEFAYDEAGREVLRSSRSARPDGTERFEERVATEYDARGLISRREQRWVGGYGGAGALVLTYHYACGE